MESKVRSNLLLWGSIYIFLTLMDLVIPIESSWMILTRILHFVWIVGVFVMLFSERYDFFAIFRKKHPRLTYYLNTVGWIAYVDYIAVFIWLVLIFLLPSYSIIFNSLLGIWTMIKLLLIPLCPFIGFIRLRKNDQLI